MKIKIYSLISICALIVLMSCTKDPIGITPSSNITTEDFSFVDFSQIEVNGPFALNITISNSPETVSIEANENLQEFITVSKIGSKLLVEFDNGISISGNPTINLSVSMSNPSEIRGSGALAVTLENGITSTDLDVYLSGASTLTGALNLENFNADISGASSFNLTGHVDEFDIIASGASLFNGYNFDADYFDAVLSGASVFRLVVNTSIELTASGASFLYYKGEAQVNEANVSGASQIVKVN